MTPTNDARRPTVPFGKVPSKMVQAGAYRHCSKNESKVLHSLCAHINGETWTVNQLSVPTIAFEAGVSERTVQRVIPRLVDKGLVKVTIEGGRGRCNAYEVVTNPDTINDGVFHDGNPDKTPQKPRQSEAGSVSKRTRNPDTMNDGVSHDGNPDKTTHEPRQSEAVSVSNRTRNPDTQGDTRTEEQSKQSNRGAGCARAAAAGAPADLKIAAAVIKAGIGEPKRSELAASWTGIPNAARHIESTNAELRNKGKGTGAVVLELEARADAERSKAVTESARQSTRQQRLNDQRKADAATETNWQECFAYLKGLTPKQLEQEKTAAIADNPRISKDWQEADPLENRGLAGAIYRRRGDGTPQNTH